MATVRGLCRHCGQEPASRPRGLGWQCYYRPGIRDLYPPDPRGGRVWANPSQCLPAQPTEALPGSAAKIRVMAERVRCGECLCHPRDARLTGECPGGDELLTLLSLEKVNVLAPRGGNAQQEGREKPRRQDYEPHRYVVPRGGWVLRRVHTDKE